MLEVLNRLFRRFEECKRRRRRADNRDEFYDGWAKRRKDLSDAAFGLAEYLADAPAFHCQRAKDILTARKFIEQCTRDVHQFHLLHSIQAKLGAVLMNAFSELLVRVTAGRFRHKRRHLRCCLPGAFKARF